MFDATTAAGGAAATCGEPANCFGTGAVLRGRSCVGVPLAARKVQPYWWAGLQGTKFKFRENLIESSMKPS
jgi:putative intracellular protease/amidase